MILRSATGVGDQYCDGLLFARSCHGEFFNHFSITHWNSHRRKSEPSSWGPSPTNLSDKTKPVSPLSSPPAQPQSPSLLSPWPQKWPCCIFPAWCTLARPCKSSFGWKKPPLMVLLFAPCRGFRSPSRDSLREGLCTPLSRSRCSGVITSPALPLPRERGTGWFVGVVSHPSTVLILSSSPCRALRGAGAELPALYPHSHRKGPLDLTAAPELRRTLAAWGDPELQLLSPAEAAGGTQWMAALAPEQAFPSPVLFPVQFPRCSFPQTEPNPAADPSLDKCTSH